MSNVTHNAEHIIMTIWNWSDVTRQTDPL